MKKQEEEERQNLIRNSLKKEVRREYKKRDNKQNLCNRLVHIFKSTFNSFKLPTLFNMHATFILPICILIQPLDHFTVS